MKFIFFIFLIMMILPFNSCSTRRGMSYNQRSVGHYRLYSYPHSIKKNDFNPRYKKITITSINNLNGSIQPKSAQFYNSRYDKTDNIYWGGINGIKAYLDILKTQNDNQVLVLDSGSFLNKDGPQEKTLFLLNYLKVDAANLGNNEFFINNKNALKKFISLANYPILASNLIDLKTHDLPPWKNLVKGSLKTINGISIGVLGVYSPNLSKELDKEKLTGLYFQNMAKTIIQASDSLRKSGAKVIIALLSAPLNCSLTSSELGLPSEKINFDFSSSLSCDKQSEVVKVLEQLPSYTIDAVITSGSMGKTANIINGYPVMQNHGNGEFLSWMNLYYDTKYQRVATEKTHIFQPVKTCHQFFKDTEDCYASEKLENEDEVELVPAIFLDQVVKILPIP